MRSNKQIKNKKMSILIMTILFIINSIVSYNAMHDYFSLDLNNGKSSNAVIILSWLGVITILFALYTWNKTHHELISPYMILFLTMYLYCYGQSICWILGIYDFYKDLVLRESQYFIVQSMAYTLPFITLFHLMALIIPEKIITLDNVENQFVEYDNKALFKVGLLFAVISTPAFLINLYTSVKLVISYGYDGIYYYKPIYSRLINILLYASEYFEPAVICIMVAKYKNKLIRNTTLALFCLNILASLYIGGRSGAVVPLLCIICIWHYIIKKINIKQGLILIGLAYIFVGILNAVAVVRNQAGHGFSEILNVFYSSGTNIISNFVGEIGWSLTSVGYTMEFVPSLEPFRYGSSYLYGLSTIVPNIGFWDVHPATLHAQLTNWLQAMLNIDFGPGYTIVAETYINFGWYGLAFAAFEGTLIGWILSRINKQTAQYNLSSTAFTIVFLLVGLQPLIRSCFVVAFRNFAYVFGGMFIVYIFIRNHYRNENIAIKVHCAHAH